MSVSVTDGMIAFFLVYLSEIQFRYRRWLQNDRLERANDEITSKETLHERALMS